MSDNLKAGIRFTPDIYAEIGYDSQNETGDMSVIGANGETIWESGEGGGGSSDLSIANVTITNTTGHERIFMPICMLDDDAPIDGYTAADINFESIGSVTYQVPLFKGGALALGGESIADNVMTIFTNVTGSGTLVDSIMVLITGDCTITTGSRGQ